MNNGITILSDKVCIVGNNVQIENVQIVNGLQTSETIYNYFKSNENNEDSRSIMVKVLATNNKELKDNIIKSTNNQTSVEISALRATDKIQRDIEERLSSENLYYERRTNYYFNMGVDYKDIVTPLYLAYAYTSLILKLPYQAIKLKSRFMSDEKKYRIIFSDEINLDLWPILAKVFKKTDLFLEKNKITTNFSEKYLRSYRPVLSFLSLSKLFNNFNFNENDLLRLDLNDYNDELMFDLFNDINNLSCNWNSFNSFKNKKNINSICIKVSEKYNIPNIESIIDRNNPFQKEIPKYNLDEEFIDKVRKLLPQQQPWPVGTHSRIAKELGVFTPKVSQAIHELENRGEYYIQKGQKLYEKDGNEILS